MRKIDLAGVPVSSGSNYPESLAAPCLNKLRRRLSRAAGLTEIGINLLELEPGAWSSQRHWHSRAEEFVYVLEGEVVLVTEAGEEVLRAGDSAGFRAGHPEEAHHLQNRSSALARILEIGPVSLRDDETQYPDVDLHATAAGYFRKDGSRY